MPTLAILALLCLGAARDDFGEQLALLGAPRAAERAAAERWLEVHLAEEHYAALAAAARAGDAEVRGRLQRVLSSDARHLGLALALCAEDDPGLSLLGREAVRAGVARADPRLGEFALREGLEGWLRHAATQSAPRSLRVDPRRPLEGLVEELTLVGELPLGLTLDPRVASSAVRREEEFAEGPWNDVLVRLANALGVVLECHGLARGPRSQESEGAFLRLTVKGEPARSGVDVVSDWLFTLARAGEPAARARAARNLAASGFAPALAWMDLLARTRADPAAREGLLAAAVRGSVAPALTGALEALVAQAESEGGRGSARLLCALSHVGCFDAQGAPLAPRLLAGFDGASARGRWIRLFLLERAGCAVPELAQRARALLAERATPPALRLQALLALAGQLDARTPGAPPVAELEALFRVPLDEVGRERLGRTLALLEVAPPLADATRIPADWSADERAALLQAWLWRDAAEPVAAQCSAWLGIPGTDASAGGERLAEELRPWILRGRGEFLDGALRRAQALAPAQAAGLARVRLLTGLAPAAEVPELLARGRYALQGPDADLALVGALAGYPTEIAAEVPARDLLIERFAEALAANRTPEECRALIAALERAARGLYAAGRDEPATSRFSGTVRGLLLRPKTALARRFERQSWPPAPFVPRCDVARALACFEVPASL